jgi:hypothetical protein
MPMKAQDERLIDIGCAIVVLNITVDKSAD